MKTQHIIKKPLVTEKTMQRVSQNQYSFEVHKTANKAQIADAVANLFDVTVFRVKILNRKGKEKRIWRTRRSTLTATQKIAIVTIDPKQSIDLFSDFDASKVEQTDQEEKKSKETNKQKTKASTKATKEKKTTSSKQEEKDH
jgi:large subunit ribosomal protein L23